jgi:hypothetical protein
MGPIASRGCRSTLQRQGPISGVHQEVRVRDAKTREAFSAEHHALLLVHEEAQQDQEKRMLPWSCHTAHLYTTMSVVLQRELGSAGVTVSQVVLEAFAARFGPAMADVLAADAGTDFDVLPEGR